MIFKNLLIGLGSAGVIGGGGYMIYNATKSSDSKEEIKDETEKNDPSGDNQNQLPSPDQQEESQLNKSDSPTK